MPSARRQESKWLRLWRRRLRRRPLLPFLLAATVAVDVVIGVSGLQPVASPVFAGVDPLSLNNVVKTLAWPLALGFVSGQLGLLGIWLASALRGLLSRGVVAVPASLGVAWVLASLFDGAPAGNYRVTAAYGLIAVVLVAALVGGVRVFSARRRGRRRRFGIAYLLTATTLVAVTIQIALFGNWAFVDDASVLVMIGFEALIPVAVWLASRTRYGSIASISIALAALIGTGCALTVTGDAQFVAAVVVNFVGQAFVVALWLWLLEPRRRVVAEQPECQRNEPSTSSIEAPTHDSPDSQRSLRYDPAHPSVLKMHIDLTA